MWPWCLYWLPPHYRHHGNTCWLKMKIAFLWKILNSGWNENEQKDVHLHQGPTSALKKMNLFFWIISEGFIMGYKKTFFGRSLPNVFTNPSTQGFCEIWENERWNSGRKGRFSGLFGGVLMGLDLVCESATPPTHIWERSPKKSFFCDSFPNDT